MRPYLEKPFTKIGLVEWLKVKALSSSLGTAKKKHLLKAVEEKQHINVFILILGENSMNESGPWRPEGSGIISFKCQKNHISLPNKKILQE
jgi:hypothetical protein